MGRADPRSMFLYIMMGHNKKIMGKNVNTRRTRIMAWLIVAVMILAGAALIWEMVRGLLSA